MSGCVRWFRGLAVPLAAALIVLAAPPGMAFADSGRQQAKPEERAAELIRPSVMYLAGQSSGLVRLPSGEILSQFGRGSSMPFLATWDCTAFVVNPDGWVATAGHCVDPASAKPLILKRAATEYRSQYPDAPESRDPATAFEWLQKNATVEGDTAGQGPPVSFKLISGTGTKLAAKLPASVVEFRPLGEGDVAVLKVAKGNLPSSELGTDADVTVGTSILTVGFPGSTQNITGPSLDPTYKSGKISKKSTMGPSPEYEIDAAMSEGMSGGPTVGLNGKVVGVNSFAPAGEMQAFNFVAPADGLAALLAARSVRPMLGPADLSYRRGLKDYYSGRYTDAIGEFDQAVALSPGYPGLDDLKTSAFNLRQQYGDRSPLSGAVLLWYMIISVVSVIGVSAGLTLLVLRTRRQRPHSAATSGASPVLDGQPASGGIPATSTDRQAVTVTEETSVSDVAYDTGGVHPLRLIPSQQSDADQPHFCAQCGAAHHPAEHFCPNCGHRIISLQSAEETGLIS
ncbi:trypsin-like serine protease [Mycobacterium intracellulare subsp. chimaera]|uniref:Trypsin-like serine protease n=1 Tax=Mycobacterium intracellulare subsp. chimaera TaxID=222805 RepID=A0A7U5MKE7_MYCIT|nr:trypsin-like serine protease [Mycobacterium intracellulare subsp. chimaera]ASQ86331.1 trypsin [Mycobacterium intracellulare subsp. chimaera]